jgi:hypothetical protein
MYKKNSEKYKRIFLLGIISILLGLLWLKNQTIDSLRLLNTEVTQEITKDGKYMAIQRQNIMDLEYALKRGYLEKEKYMKNVKSQTRIQFQTIVEQKLIPFHDTVKIYYDTLDKRFWVKTPAPIRFQDSFNILSGKFTKDGFELDSLETKNEFRVSIFDKKQGFLKKSIPVVEIKSNNPKTQTTNIKNVTIEKKSPIYKKWWFVGSVGMLIGYFII